MQNTEYLENRFLEKIVDRSKQLYLRKKKPFESLVIPFKGTKAWVIPFTPRDMEHKKMLVHIVAAGFASKDITRFGYFFDAWTAEGPEMKDLDGLDPEERKRRIREHRERLPMDYSKGDFEGRGEAISWGIITENGPVSYTCQRHDSRTHTLLSKAVSTGEVKAEMHIFEQLIPISKGADFRKAGMSKAEMWNIMEDYFRLEACPVVEVDIRC